MAGKLQKILIRSLLLAGLFLQGSLLSLLWIHVLNAPPEDDSNIPVVEQTLPTFDPQTGIHVVDPQMHRQLAEQFLLANDPGQALPHLLNAAEPQILRSDDDLLFRLALCLEAAGNLDRANSYYETVFNRSSDPWLVAKSRNGQARCRLQQDKTEDARQLLWRQYLWANGNLSTELENEVVFLIAVSFQDSSDHSLDELLSQDYFFRRLVPKPDISDLLRTLIKLRKPATEAGETAQAPTPVTRLTDVASIEIKEIVRAGEALEEVIATYLVSQSSLLNVFQQMTSRLGLPFGITDEARRLAEAQNITLRFEHTNLPTILDAQTLPFGLGWSYVNGEISIFAQHEVNPDDARQLQLNASRRLLERFRITSNNKRYLPYAQFLLAGIYAGDLELTRAVQTWADLLDQSIDERLRQTVNFNLGQLHSKLDARTRAINAYSRVVDSNAGGFLAPVAYLKLGNLVLQEGRQDEAVTAFSRAIRLSDERTLRQIGAIGISTAYLLNEQYNASTRALKDHARHFRSPSMQEISGFLEQISPALENPQAEIPFDEKTRMLSALSKLNWPECLKVPGQFIAARGFLRLGFREEALRLMDAGIQDGCGAWLRQKFFEQLATALKKAAQTEELQALLVKADQHADTASTGVILISLADLAWQNRRADDCLNYCYQLFEMPATEPFHAQALQLMGSVFQSRGQHNHAALCLAGLLPLEVSPTSAEQSE